MLSLEDLKPGDRFAGTATVTITEEDIVAFARQYDPQPFHLDHEAARESVFRGLAASGWHTAALTMRLIVTGGVRFAGGHVGLGTDELAWPTAVRPGDTLRIESEILEVRPSASNPARGVVKVRTVTYNQNGQPVQRLVANLLVPRRAA